MFCLHPFLQAKVIVIDELLFMETRPHVQAAGMQPVARLKTVRWNLRYGVLRKFFHIVLMICLISV